MRWYAQGRASRRIDLPLPLTPAVGPCRRPRALALLAIAAVAAGCFAAGRQAGLAESPPGQAAIAPAPAARSPQGTGPSALTWVHQPVTAAAAAGTGAPGPDRVRSEPGLAAASRGASVLSATGTAAAPGQAAPSRPAAAEMAIATPTAAMVPDPATSLVAVESFTAASDLPGGDVHLGTGFVVATDGAGAWVATAAHVVMPSILGLGAGSTGASAAGAGAGTAGGSGAGSAGDAAAQPAVAVYVPGQQVPHVADRVEIDPHADLALLHVPFLPGAAAVDLGRVPHSAWAGEVSCVRWPDWTFQAYPIPLQPGAFPSTGRNYGVLPTPQLSVLPGCSGGPLDVYGATGGGAAVVVGTVVSGTVDPPGVGFVPAAAIQSLLASQASASSAG